MNLNNNKYLYLVKIKTLIFSILLLNLLLQNDLYSQKFSDVLTPSKRTNTPNYLLSISAGINLSNYFNDKFLDNSPFDIGEVSGEYDIYGSSSGIGYNFNSELEVPLNSNFSYLFGLSYIKSNFNSSGIVEEFCYKSDSTKILSNTNNSFKVNLDYISFSPSIKLRLSDNYFTLGFVTSYCINSNYEVSRFFSSKNCKFKNMENEIKINSEVPKVVNLHYAFRLGYGLIYRLSNTVEWSPELLFNFGIYPINKSNNSDLGIYSLNSSFRFSL